MWGVGKRGEEERREGKEGGGAEREERKGGRRGRGKGGMCREVVWYVARGEGRRGVMADEWKLMCERQPSDECVVVDMHQMSV